MDFTNVKLPIFKKPTKKKVKFLINIEIVMEGELSGKEKKLITTISSFSIQKKKLERSCKKNKKLLQTCW